jgi:hypothetical protein
VDRIKQSRSDLRAALKEQVSLLVNFCTGYDAGMMALAKPMATALRVCLHHRGRSTSLLQQLGLRSGRFFTAPGRVAHNTVPIGCSLTAMTFRDGSGLYAPNLDRLSQRDRLPFPEWWTGVVLRAPTGETMSRMDIVTAVADMDGGAHVDPSLAPLYARFRSGELLGMRAFPIEDGQIRMVLPILLPSEQVVKDADLSVGLLTSPQYPSIRTVAHELLLTMERYAAWSFAKPYQFAAEQQTTRTRPEEGRP